VISYQKKKFYSNLTNYFASLPKNHLNSFHFVLNLKLLKLGHFDLVLNFVEMMDGYISYVSTHSVLFYIFFHDYLQIVCIPTVNLFDLSKLYANIIMKN
jgi:hypothetical protein